MFSLLSNRLISCLLLLFLFPIFFEVSESSKAKATTTATNENDTNKVFCTVCRIVVSEANWAIGQIDPNKIIEHGSFRVDPDGEQPYKKKKKYSRSETFLDELLEEICDKFINYAQLTTQAPLESKHIVRWQGFNKERLQSKDLKLDYDAGKNLKYKCNDFLEEHFDWVIESLQREDITNYEQYICGEPAAHVCSDEELAMPMMTLPEAAEDDPSDHPVLEDHDDHPGEEDVNYSFEEKRAMAEAHDEKEETEDEDHLTHELHPTEEDLSHFKEEL